METALGYMDRTGPDERRALLQEVGERIPVAAEEASDRDALEERVLRVLRRCRETGEPSLANPGVRRITGLDRHQARRLLRELAARGLVTRSGHGPGTRYVYVGPDGRSR